MPTIVAERDGTCRACGYRVRKGEYADYTAAKGLAHLECAKAPAQHRPNNRAASCSRCRTWVAAKQGRLRLLEDKGAQGGGKRWAVDCARCARLSSAEHDGGLSQAGAVEADPG